ncbi:unnamed protein product [Lepeophtheirus salmonis]|uniref:(salmon louse) hypothetical protein n=1 Tax=Lepeophtheirus salmonis TaxID=72036 RepID=A0A7R8HDN4_LEPSM|nr:unnamed protein product [Lepeophtheirus salmonis]CAF3038004.1 unnamed protein product [Lepeophtheirus salmonis]
MVQYELNVHSVIASSIPTFFRNLGCVKLWKRYEVLMMISTGHESKVIADILKAAESSMVKEMNVNKRPSETDERGHPGDSLQGVSLRSQTGPQIDPLSIEPYKPGEEQCEIG